MFELCVCATSSFGCDVPVTSHGDTPLLLPPVPHPTQPHTDLQPGTTYYYRVADTSGGNGDDAQKLKDSSYNGKEHSFTVSRSLCLN